MFLKKPGDFLCIIENKLGVINEKSKDNLS
ncbi:hypothetical protein LM901099_30067 [Listeria monocytogenes]|nr:hypothetical protein LM901099_30067 [Listeria monocytogenes]